MGSSAMENVASNRWFGMRETHFFVDFGAPTWEVETTRLGVLGGQTWEHIEE